MDKPTVGFELTNRDIKMAYWDGEGVQKTARVALPPEAVDAGVVMDAGSVADLIKKTLQEEGISAKQAAVIVPSSRAYLRRLKMPAMTVGQLAVNLPYEFRDFLSEAPDHYFYDYALNDMTYDEEGRPLEMDLTAAAVAKSLIEDYRALFRRAGLRLVTAVPVECALANLLMDKDSAREYCIINVGYEATSVYIYTGPHFEADRQMDDGMHSVDKVLALETAEGEETPVDYNAITDNEEVQSVYSAIVMDIRKAINFYSYNNRASNLTDVWCAGEGGTVTALQEAIAQSTGMSIHHIEELLPQASEDARELSLFAAAIGAAMQ